MRYSTLKLILAAVACLSVIAVAQIPTIRITTQNNQEPTVSGGGMFGGAQTMNYVKITNFELYDQNNPRNNLTLTPEPAPSESDSIRVRGNSTAGQNKKPYRIKFDKKQGLFGKEKAKSWVLIANYYDYTLCLNASALELGKAVGLEFTNTYEFVDVYINNNYKGIYMLTEQIQAGAGRVNIEAGKDKGWLIEMDYHDLEADQVGFDAPSPYQNMKKVRVREPELGGCDRNPRVNCSINNDTVKFVQTEVNAMFSAVNSGNYSTMDLESWAKYVLVQQFMDNFDFNSKTQTGALPGSNYAYKDAGGKIKAGPLWDFDLAAGVQDPGFMMQNWPRHYVNYTEPIRPKNTFYQKMWSDPNFICHFKKAWTDNKSKFSAVTGTMDNIANKVKGSAQANFAAYTDGMAFGDTRPNSEATYTAEVAKLKSWWTSRVTWFDTEVNKLTTSVTNCNTVVTPSSSSTNTQSSSSNSSSSSGTVNTTPLICNLTNSGTTGVVNTPIVPANIFTVYCGTAPVATSTLTWQANLTPTSVGNFNITVNRAADASTCPGTTATCTVQILATAPSSSSTPSSSSIGSGFVCALTNASTIGTVGTAIIPQNVFTTYCNGRSTSNVTWPTTNLTPQSTEQPFTITVTRPQSAQDCQGLTATCTLPMSAGQTPIMLPKIASNNAIMVIKNGVELQTKNSARIEVYNLRGKLEKTMNFASGVYSVSLSDMPKGMYIVKVSFGSEKRILQLPVR